MIDYYMLFRIYRLRMFTSSQDGLEETMNYNIKKYAECVRALYGFNCEIDSTVFGDNADMFIMKGQKQVFTIPLI